MGALPADSKPSRASPGRGEARADIAEILDHLPKAPGVYLIKDGEGKILYIGKAKSLRSRVHAYFRPFAHDGRPQLEALLKHARDLETIVTDTELEALILEANLIKAHKPKYNINLKDDKKYPFVRITKEPFPRIIVTRNLVRDGSRYLGPYSDVKSLRRTMDTMHRLFRVRSCDFALPSSHVRLCLDYEIGRCDGPCEGLISRKAYEKIVEEAVLFLTGRHVEVIRTLKERMQALSEARRFEDAAACRDRIRALEQTTRRQKVVSNSLSDWDAIAVSREDEAACGVVMEVREGRLIGRQHYFIDGVLHAPMAEIVSAFVRLFYVTASFVPEDIHLPCDIEDRETVADWLRDKAGRTVEIHTPRRGDKARLLKMAERNAALLLSERRLKRERRRTRIPAAVAALQRDLHLGRPPQRIEAVDISNLQGSDPVASLVSFVGGRPRKKDYRHFRITGVAGPNDFAMMEQVVTRRFRRLRDEGRVYPDLLLVDGGKGQLSSALSALEALGLRDQRVVGLAKRLEEVFLPGHPDAQNIPKTSSSLRLLQAIRDESHRFALTYHRKLRKRRTLASELDDITGVGPARRRALLRHFSSLKRVKAAEVAEVAAVEGIGPKLAKQIHDALRPGTARKDRGG